MKRFLLGSLLLPLALAGIGCGDDLPPPTSFQFEVRFQSIILNAIDELRFSFQPQRADERFAAMPERSYEGGAITAGTTGDGQLVLLVDGAYVRENFMVIGGFTEAFRLPVYPTDTSASQTVVMDPQVAVAVIRRGETLGEARRFVAWPIPNGEECDMRSDMCIAQVTVACRMGFSFQCRNEDPPAGVDAGPPTGDGG